MQDLADATRIKPGSKVDLGDHPPDAKLGLRDEKSAREQTAKRAGRMAELATMLMAEHKRSLLVVLQGMDASGKDGTVKHCFGGLNPMSVRVAGFKAPTRPSSPTTSSGASTGSCRSAARSASSTARTTRTCSSCGSRSSCRSRSGSGATRPSTRSRSTSRRGHDRRQALPAHLAGGAGRALPERLATPTKNWKFSADDLAKREKWDEYMTAYRAMLERTSTDAAPWHIVPADHKWVRDPVVTDVLTRTLEGLDLKWPELAPEIRGLVVPD